MHIILLDFIGFYLLRKADGDDRNFYEARRKAAEFTPYPYVYQNVHANDLRVVWSVPYTDALWAQLREQYPGAVWDWIEYEDDDPIMVAPSAVT